jgi:hypothetical protein
MDQVAWWAGKLAASVADPLNWLLIAVCFGVGAGRYVACYAMALAVGFSVLELAALQLSPLVVGYHLAFRFVFAFVAWRAGKLIVPHGRKLET